jgi:streptogramin lyase
MTSESLTADTEFMPKAMFVTKEEVIYILDNHNARILRFNPAVSFKPVVVGQVPEQGADLQDLFVTEAGTIYIADQGQRKVLAMRPGEATFTEVLECPDGLSPSAVLVQDRSLYVSTVTEGLTGGCLYEYVLPDELHLE